MDGHVYCYFNSLPRHWEWVNISFSEAFCLCVHASVCKLLELFELFELFANICTIRTIRRYFYYSYSYSSGKIQRILFVFVFVKKTGTNNIRIRIRRQKRYSSHSVSGRFTFWGISATLSGKIKKCQTDLAGIDLTMIPNLRSVLRSGDFFGGALFGHFGGSQNG